MHKENFSKLKLCPCFTVYSGELFRFTLIFQIFKTPAWIVLERNAQDKLDDFYEQVQYFTDATVCWENTLAALKRGNSGPNMVKELDPDAPCRTGKKLHNLDLEFEQPLLKALFVCVRCCLLEEGQDLCVRVRQAWRDGGYIMIQIMRVGWVEGRSCRWRATSTGMCGNWWPGTSRRTAVSGSSRGQCTQRDVEMVETEIRETMVKTFSELSPQYWNTPQSMGKVFQEIEGRGGGVAREAESPHHVIQRRVILDDWPGLS